MREVSGTRGQLPALAAPSVGRPVRVERKLLFKNPTALLVTLEMQLPSAPLDAPHKGAAKGIGTLLAHRQST